MKSWRKPQPDIKKSGNERASWWEDRDDFVESVEESLSQVWNEHHGKREDEAEYDPEQVWMQKQTGSSWSWKMSQREEHWSGDEHFGGPHRSREEMKQELTPTSPASTTPRESEEDAEERQEIRREETRGLWANWGE